MLIDDLKADAAIFANPTEFGETVAFTPQTVTVDNPARNVPAVVDRTPPHNPGATARTQIDQTVVHVAKATDPALGLIVRPTLNGDTFTVGGKVLVVAKIMDESDAGMWHLQLN